MSTLSHTGSAECGFSFFVVISVRGNNSYSQFSSLEENFLYQFWEKSEIFLLFTYFNKTWNVI